MISWAGVPKARVLFSYVLWRHHRLKDDLWLPLQVGQKRESGAGARATLPEGEDDHVTWDSWTGTLSVILYLVFKPTT